MSLDLDLIIRNGIVVTAADETACDIGCKDGKVVLLMANMPVPEGCKVIDAEGGYVTVRLPLSLSCIPTSPLTRFLVAAWSRRLACAHRAVRGKVAWRKVGRRLDHRFPFRCWRCVFLMLLT